jgi:putative acetyltransferase
VVERLDLMVEKIALRPALPADAPALAALFRASVEEFGPEDYSDAQVEAWSASAEDEAAFAEKLSGKITILGLIGGEIAGFATLKGTDVLDMLYVHPRFSRRGVATQLCDALEKLAAARKATVLTADVSDGAQVFFVKRAYEPQRRNTVFVGDEILGNTTMTKQLPAMTGPTQ